MHVFIMGCGRVGAQLARTLAEAQHEVTIIDINPEIFRRLPHELAINSVVADGTRQEDLRRAGIEKADVFVAVAEGDARNGMAAQMARHIFRIPKVICRLKDPVRQEMFQSMGYEAVSPTSIVSEMILQSIRR